MPQKDSWSFLLHNNYHPHCSNMNLLWFYGGSRYPGVVTKLFATRELPEREYANLMRAYGRAPRWVPRPLHFGQHGPLWGLWMEGVPGNPLPSRAISSVGPLRHVVEGLGSMHAALRENGSAAVQGDRHKRAVARPLAALAAFGNSVAVVAGCERLASKATAQWLAAQPVIPQHGDLFVGNVLTENSEMHIIDWESFGEIDLPFHDVLTLMISTLARGGTDASQWDRNLTSQMPDLLRRYTAAAGLAAPDVSVMLPLTFANWFSLQSADGREEFTGRTYRMVEQFFAQEKAWERAFLG